MVRAIAYVYGLPRYKVIGSAGDYRVVHVRVSGGKAPPTHRTIVQQVRTLGFAKAIAELHLLVG